MLIPDNIDGFESNGEKILYQRFKNDPSTKDMVIMHSLFTNHHLVNISGELDFLVLVPHKGIFAIEVKHGHVSRKNGSWFYRNRLGNVSQKNKSPFAQVDGTMNSIRNYVLNKIKHKKDLHKRLSKVLWGTGVAFTSMDEFIDFGTEGHTWQILTRQGLYMPISYYIEALDRGWHDQNRGKNWYDINLSRPTKNDCQIILKILRGDFEIDYSDVNRIIDNDYLIDEFTKEQFHLLDFVNYNDRCLIEGAAGTGKTLMAIEVLRRKATEGLKSAFFCYNNKLGNKLSHVAQEIPECNKTENYTGTLHSFLSKNVDHSFADKSDLNRYYSEDLPLEYLIQNENLSNSDKFDILILDETQDLITPYYLEIFDFILKGGLKNGKWYFFGDFSNQAIYRNNPEETFKLLSEKSNFTKFPPLQINCRNTKKISSQNTLMTGVDMPEFIDGVNEGDYIESKFPSLNSQCEIIENILKELSSKEISLDKISLLSPKKFENTFLINSVYINNLIQNGLTFSTVHAYKGLENTIIILFDFDNINTEDSQRLLYVGISRARQKLYLILNKSLEKDYQVLIQENLKKL